MQRSLTLHCQREKVLMRTLCFLSLIAVCFSTSCTRNTDPSGQCDTNAPTSRKIFNHPATVQSLNGQFYIIEEGTIDTRLLPCFLSATYQVDNLKVIVSGEVKDPVNDGGPCCTENFQVTKISR